MKRESHAFTLGYVGSAGAWYLFDEAVATFLRLRQLRPDAQLRVVNRMSAIASASAWAPSVSMWQRRTCLPPVTIRCRRRMARIDSGMFLVKAVFSKQATAPRQARRGSRLLDSLSVRLGRGRHG